MPACTQKIEPKADVPGAPDVQLLVRLKAQHAPTEGNGVTELGNGTSMRALQDRVAAHQNRLRTTRHVSIICRAEIRRRSVAKVKQPRDVLVRPNLSVANVSVLDKEFIDGPPQPATGDTAASGVNGGYGGPAVEGSTDPVPRNLHTETTLGGDPSKVDKDGARAGTSEAAACRALKSLDSDTETDNECFEVDLPAGCTAAAVSWHKGSPAIIATQKAGLQPFWGWEKRKGGILK